MHWRFCSAHAWIRSILWPADASLSPPLQCPLRTGLPVGWLCAPLWIQPPFLCRPSALSGRPPGRLHHGQTAGGGWPWIREQGGCRWEESSRKPVLGSTGPITPNCLEVRKTHRALSQTSPEHRPASTGPTALRPRVRSRGRATCDFPRPFVSDTLRNSSALLSDWPPLLSVPARLHSTPHPSLTGQGTPPFNSQGLQLSLWENLSPTPEAASGKSPPCRSAREVRG